MKATATIASPLCLSLCLVFTTGCRFHHPTAEERDQKLKQDTAKATIKAREDARLAVGEAKVAADVASRKLHAIASGVREGMKSDKPSAARLKPVNVNRASTVELAALPGVSGARARRIVEGRPYRTKAQLVDKGVLTQEQLDRLSARITAD